MKKILCFGDSNTFGFAPEGGIRYDKSTRWTGVLASMLSDEYTVIEAGCNNRNGFIDSIDGELFTGYKVLPRYLMTPPDITIIWFGANDIQKFYNPTLDVIESGLENMIKTIKDAKSEVLVISPPVLNNDVLNGFFSCQFDEESVKKSEKLPEIYKKIAEKHHCLYININDYVSVSNIDGLHYSPESHKEIAKVIYNTIKK